MSILKFFSGEKDDIEYKERTYSYLSEAHKTDNRKYIGTYGCSLKNPIRDMTTVARGCHKAGGRQGEHFVLSLTPDLDSVDNETYMQIAARIASHLSDFQSVYTLHLDTNVRHLHFLINSVSIKDGHKFKQSRTDLNVFKTYCNHVITKYGFEPIKAGGPHLFISTPYDPNDESIIFDSDERWPSYANTSGILVDTEEYEAESLLNSVERLYRERMENGDDNDDFYDCGDGYYCCKYDDYTNRKKGGKSKSKHIKRKKQEDFKMSKNNYLKAADEPSYLSKLKKKGKSKLKLNSSRNINIKVDSRAKLAEVREVFSNIHDKSMEEKIEDTKLCIEVTRKFLDSGNNVDIESDSSVNLNIDYTGSNAFDEESIIEADSFEVHDD